MKKKRSPTHKILDLPVLRNVPNVSFILVEPQTPGDVVSATAPTSAANASARINMSQCEINGAGAG